MGAGSRPRVYSGPWRPSGAGRSGIRVPWCSRPPQDGELFATPGSRYSGDVSRFPARAARDREGSDRVLPLFPTEGPTSPAHGCGKERGSTLCVRRPGNLLCIRLAPALRTGARALAGLARGERAAGLVAALPRVRAQSQVSSSWPLGLRALGERDPRGWVAGGMALSLVGANRQRALRCRSVCSCGAEPARQLPWKRVLPVALRCTPRSARAGARGVWCASYCSTWPRSLLDNRRGVWLAARRR